MGEQRAAATLAFKGGKWLAAAAYCNAVYFYPICTRCGLGRLAGSTEGWIGRYGGHTRWDLAPWASLYMGELQRVAATLAVKGGEVGLYNSDFFEENQP